MPTYNIHNSASNFTVESEDNCTIAEVVQLALGQMEGNLVAESVSLAGNSIPKEMWGLWNANDGTTLEIVTAEAPDYSGQITLMTSMYGVMHVDAPPTGMTLQSLLADKLPALSNRSRINVFVGSELVYPSDDATRNIVGGDTVSISKTENNG